MGRIHNNDSALVGYLIRIPLKMIQLTEQNGKAWPLAFDWEDSGGEIIKVQIDRVISVVPCSELKSGTVGDRYECEINGKREFLYLSKLQPRKWFRLHEVGEREYNAYYRLPNEQNQNART